LIFTYPLLSWCLMVFLGKVVKTRLFPNSVNWEKIWLRHEFLLPNLIVRAIKAWQTPRRYIGLWQSKYVNIVSSVSDMQTRLKNSKASRFSDRVYLRILTCPRSHLRELWTKPCNYEGNAKFGQFWKLNEEIWRCWIFCLWFGDFKSCLLFLR
jgi:hypothetical protein